MQIDLHNMTYYEAIRHFIKRYNDILKSGENEIIEVIHGYGSGGKGGIIKRRFRKYLKEHCDYLEFEPGEGIRGLNQGLTLVIPKKPLPELTDMLETEIIEYCSQAPKTMEKIKGHLFKRYDEKYIKSTVKSLVKKGLLKEELKRRGAVYSKT